MAEYDFKLDGTDIGAEISPLSGEGLGSLRPLKYFERAVGFVCISAIADEEAKIIRQSLSRVKTRLFIGKVTCFTVPFDPNERHKIIDDISANGSCNLPVEVMRSGIAVITGKDKANSPVIGESILFVTPAANFDEYVLVSEHFMSTRRVNPDLTSGEHLTLAADMRDAIVGEIHPQLLAALTNPTDIG